MGRGWKILIGVVVALAVLLGVNVLVIDGETKPAGVTEPGGRIVNWWDGVMPRLDRDHRVIAIDLLGHGGSEKPSSGYSIEN